MWWILVFVVVAMLLPLSPVLFARMGAGTDELEASFHLESVVVDGKRVPTSELKVLHRSCGTASYSRAGDLMQIDAAWLCQAPDGDYLLALAQGLRYESELALLPWNRTALPITWSWRHLSEAQARSSLAHDRVAYRAVFGSNGKLRSEAEA
jgi:hypothetical protein